MWKLIKIMFTEPLSAPPEVLRQSSSAPEVTASGRPVAAASHWYRQCVFGGAIQIISSVHTGFVWVAEAFSRWLPVKLLSWAEAVNRGPWFPRGKQMACLFGIFLQALRLPMWAWIAGSPTCRPWSHEPLTLAGTFLLNMTPVRFRLLGCGQLSFSSCLLLTFQAS